MFKEKSLKEKTAKGLLWGGINNGGQQIINFIFGVFMARLLSPADYGLVGMLTIFSALAASLQESGFISALTRKKNVTAEDYTAVFWFNILVGLSLYVILFFSAPLIAAYYRQPLLVPLSRVCFLSFVFACFNTTHRAWLFRNLRVKETALMSMGSLLLSSIIGLTLVLLGCSYWALAFQNISFCFIMTILAWHFSGFRPGFRPHFKRLKGMLSFSSKLLFTNIFTIVNNNIFSLLLGRYYTKQMVGYYSQGNKWTNLGHNTITGMLMSVTQPIFARLQDESQERKQRVFLKMAQFTVFLSFPALFGLAFVAPELITLAIGQKWHFSAELMQILCIGGAFSPLMQLYSNVLISHGKSNVFMYNTIALCLIQTSMLALLYPYGVKTMVLAYVLLNIAWIPVWHRRLRKIMSLPFYLVLKTIFPFLLLIVLSLAVAWLGTLWAQALVWRLALKVAITGLLYIGTAKMLKIQILDETIRYFVKKKQ